ETERPRGPPLPPAVPETPPEDVYRDHVGVHPQKQPGLFSAGVSIARGRITPHEMRAAAALAERHGSGALRTQDMQGLGGLDVPGGSLTGLLREAEAAGLALEASSFRRGTVACTGSEFCKIALTETKGFAARLVEELEARMPGFDRHLKLHVTGWPNSRGQHRIGRSG